MSVRYFLSKYNILRPTSPLNVLYWNLNVSKSICNHLCVLKYKQKTRIVFGFSFLNINLCACVIFTVPERKNAYNVILFVVVFIFWFFSWFLVLCWLMKISKKKLFLVVLCCQVAILSEPWSLKIRSAHRNSYSVFIRSKIIIQQKNSFLKCNFKCNESFTAKQLLVNYILNKNNQSLNGTFFVFFIRTRTKIFHCLTWQKKTSALCCSHNSYQKKLTWAKDSHILLV